MSTSFNKYVYNKFDNMCSVPGFGQNDRSKHEYTKSKTDEGYAIEKLLLAHYIWAATRENLSSVFANNKGADQPAHPRRLISVFVIRVLESIICKLNTSEISVF